MNPFKIPVIPPTTNKTIRFPNDLIASIEEEIKGKNCTFSAFVIEAARAAIQGIKSENSRTTPTKRE